MKRIINIIFAASVLFAFAPISFAQTTLTKAEKDRIYYKDSGNGIAYSKTITPPNPQGEYDIILESFVTGEVKMKYEDAPADIILHLDMSSSMSASMGTPTRVTQQTALSYNSVVAPVSVPDADVYLYYTGSSDGYRQITAQEYNGRYYLYCAYYGNNSQHYHYLAQAANGNISLINSTSKTPPANAASSDTKDGAIITFSGANSGNNNNLYTGSSRLKELQDAVCVFIDEINTNDLYAVTEAGDTVERGNRLGNRICLITFERQTHVLFDLTFLDDSSIQSMKEKVYQMEMAQGTYPADGFTEAHNQYVATDAEYPNRKNSSTRTVVFFTDGNPANYDAIGQAYTVKSSDKAIVYTVGLFDTRPTGNNLLFLHYTSSNYPDATSIDPDDAGDGSQTAGYYQDASDADLTEIFRKIAQESGGSSNASLGSAVTAVDVVSASFVMPEGASDKVKIYTAPVIGIQEGIAQSDTTYTVEVDGETVTRHWLKFGTMTEIPNSNDEYEKLDDEGNEIVPTVWVDVDDSIKFTLTPADKPNTIRVNGFNYSGNWCGEYTDIDGNTSYHGHKVIIVIPIKMSPDAVGGPHVETNAPGSGIYVNGEADQPLVKFESPDVSLPVNIFIQKDGLKEGESAKFTIQRTLAPASSSSTWEDVTSVFVTRSKGGDESPVTKVMGLPSTDEDASKEYVYRVKEEGWSWSYTPGKEYMLSTEIITNPFIFSNTEKEDIDYRVRHAESKATNTFKTDATAVKYDDSKTNDRGGSK